MLQVQNSVLPNKASFPRLESENYTKDWTLPYIHLSKNNEHSQVTYEQAYHMGHLSSLNKNKHTFFLYDDSTYDMIHENGTNDQRVR